MAESDKSISQDCLIHQKYLGLSYARMATESSSDSLLNDVMKICQEELQANHQIFNYMNQKGWYQIQTADQNQITKAQSQVQQMQMQ